MDQEHIKRVFAHQEQQQLLLEMAERMISIENRIAKLDEKTRERLEAFLEGAKRITTRLDALESKVHKFDSKILTVRELLKPIHDKVDTAIAIIEQAQQKEAEHETQ